MNTFNDLWKRRKHHSSVKEFTRSWAKRILTLHVILKNEFRVRRLRRQGARFGSLVMLGKSEINGNAQHLCIGAGSSLGKCLVELHNNIDIGKNVSINDGAKILSASHDLNDINWKTKTKPIAIKDFAWIAMDAIILPGVTIGYGAVVAAGAVVRVNVPDFALAIGNPAKIVMKKRSKILDYEPAKFNACFEAWLG